MGAGRREAHYYDGVASPLKERLFRFRNSHPAKAIIVNGKSWQYYANINRDPTLVLLPGGLGIAEAWFDCMLQWESDYRVIAISYPAVDSVREVAAAIQAVLQREGAKQVALLGTSLGGYVAQALIREHPDLFTHVILGNTGVATPEYHRKLETQYPIAKLFINRYAFGLIKFAAKRKISESLGLLNGEDRIFWKAYMTDVIDNHYSPGHMRTQFMVALDFARNHVSIAIDPIAGKERILIIEADDDNAIPKDRRDKLKGQFPEAQVKTFHRGGHLLPVTQRDEYVRTIGDFLKSSQ
jgi:pimeloyl-ACP methyl ester carboxylesterase